MKLEILVVLYKKQFDESVAIKSIRKKINTIKNKDYEIVLHVWNNSPKHTKKHDDKDIIWHEGENTTLPIIYNTISDNVFANDKKSLLMISDDDTDYSEYDFLNTILTIENIINSDNHESCSVFIPKIYSCGILVSPGSRLFFKGKRINDVEPGMKSSKNILAINSGVVITYECYNRLKPLFNPELRFYGTDTDFFVRYGKIFKYIYVIDEKIEHELSENTIETYDRAFFRWQDYIYATRITFSYYRYPINILLKIYIFYLKVKNAIKYRSIKYMSI